MALVKSDHRICDRCGKKFKLPENYIGMDERYVVYDGVKGFKTKGDIIHGCVQITARVHNDHNDNCYTNFLPCTDDICDGSTSYDVMRDLCHDCRITILKAAIEDCEKFKHDYEV